MDKKLFLQPFILFILLMIFSSPTAGASAPESTSSVITENRWLERDGQKIYGKLFLPEETDAPLPLVILSHGLGSDHRIMEPYAENFAENGFAAFVFDYIGGSEESMSDGSMTGMSVLTEAEDLSCILQSFRSDSRFSEDEIFLFGGSQGGFISAYAAGKHPDEIAGLVLLYPAFNLQDICRKLVSDADEIPDSVVIGEHTVGSLYIRDMLTFDIYEVLRQYPGPVLLFHGTADPYVPLEYTQRAGQVLADARVVIIEGAEHGFDGEDRNRVEREAVAFVQEIIMEIGPDVRAAA
ncbi:MAG: alpha/beta fold hydrolase [Oscillospiraceae bacterium]|nr:alpha/beta fold hydrolase [Oscillospiraceae bacterium]